MSDEQLKPRSNTARSGNDKVPMLRRLGDFQVHSVLIDAIPWLQSRKGNIVEVGCGARPYRAYLSKDCNYQGIDHEIAKIDFDYEFEDVCYYEGDIFPLETDQCESVFHTDVMEHVIDCKAFLSECHRILKPGGELFFTVPFQARYHYIPHDYWRFTPSSLELLLMKAGFEDIQVKARGSDIVVAAYKVLTLFYRCLFNLNVLNLLLSLFLFPFAIIAIIAGHLALLLNMGSQDDCLGYSIHAKK